MRWFTLFFLLLNSIIFTGNAANVYTDKQLRQDKDRYVARFQFLLEKGLRDFMPAADRQVLKNAVIRHPLRGSHLVAFSATVFEDIPTVIAPLASIKLIEDLSVAYAWRHLNRYSLEPIDEYLVALKHSSELLFLQDNLPNPLTVLGVPPRIWETDDKVNDLSLRLRNTAWASILAHELGHLRLGHTQRDVSPSEKQHQEEAADAFAVNLLARSKTIPMGMILWFQMTAGYLRNRADFNSVAEYHAWLDNEAKHPINGRRMRNLASLMQNQADSTRDLNRSSALNFISERLMTMGQIVENPDVQRLLKRCAMMRELRDFKRLTNQPCF